MRRLPILAMVLASAPVFSQGLEGAIDASERMNSTLAKRNAVMLERGHECTRLVRQHKLAPGAMAQYRCLIAGVPAGATSDRTPAAAQRSEPGADAGVSLGPKAPAAR